MAITVEVIGMKAFKGTITGESINSGTLFSRVRLDDRYNKPGENFKAGYAIEEWKLSSAEPVFRMQHLTLPFFATLEIERVSNGRETKEVVIDCIPQESAAPVQAVKKAA